MTHYIGLDAHSKTCTAVVTDKSGKILQKSRFPTSEKHLLSWLQEVPRPRILAFEEMNISHWLFVILKDHVDELVIAHAPHLKKQRGAKNDTIDAIRLATELRCGTITKVFHEDNKLWDLRVLVNSYQDITKDLTRVKLRYKSLLRARGIFTEGTTPYTDESLLKTIEKDHDLFVATNIFENIRHQQSIKDAYEKRFEKLASQWPMIRSLCSIPGISHIRASIITAIICSPHRFQNKHKLWSYSKLVRHTEESDGKIYGNKKAKGRSELKAVFMGAATSVLLHKSSLRGYYDQLRSKGLNDRQAKKAVARRIAAIALMTMKTGNEYDDKHNEKRNRQESNKLLK
jgi:transposase